MYERYLNVFRTHYPAKKLAPLLAVIVALSPFAIDTYLPTMPTMAKSFNVPINFIELSIPIYLIGFALGQIIGGPISDNYGRRKIGSFGLFIFFLASVAIILSESIEQFWALRFLQAFGGGFGLVICAAVVRDLYDGKHAAKIFTLMGFIMMLAPLIAPTIGSILLAYFNWQSIFVLLSIYSFVQIFMIMLFVPETKRLRRVGGYQHLPPVQVIKNYWSIITNRNALPFLLCGSFVASALFAFLTEISFLYIDYFSVTESGFAWLFGMNIVCMMIFNRLNHFLLDKLTPRKILRIGLLIQNTAALILLSSAIFQFLNLYLVVALLMLIIGSFGIIAPNNMACYMKNFPMTSGTANAVNGASQFTFGAIIGLGLSFLHNGTPIPMFSVIFISTILSFISFRFSKETDD